MACGVSGATPSDILEFLRTLEKLAAGQQIHGLAGGPAQYQSATKPARAACSQALLPPVLVNVYVGFRLRRMLEPETGWQLQWWLSAAAALSCCLAMLCALEELTRATERASCRIVLGSHERWCYYEGRASFAMALWLEVAGALLASQLAHSLWLVTPFQVLIYFDRCVLAAVGLWAGGSLLFALAVLALRLLFEAGAVFTM